MSNVTRMADFTADSARWSVRQMLDAACEDIDTGELRDPAQAVLIVLDRQENGALLPCTYLATINYAEHVAILALAQAKAIDDWRNK